MKIYPPAGGTDQPGVSARDLCHVLGILLAGPLVLGGVIFWAAYFVYLARKVSERIEGNPPAAAPAAPR